VIYVANREAISKPAPQIDNLKSNFHAVASIEAHLKIADLPNCKNTRSLEETSASTRSAILMTPLVANI
jgi:hypothetical protein